jgi:hypothetical protein
MCLNQGKLDVSLINQVIKQCNKSRIQRMVWQRPWLALPLETSYRPFMIFKGKWKKPEFCDVMPPGTVVEMSESGYMHLEHFPSGFSVFTCIDVLDLLLFSCMVTVVISNNAEPDYIHLLCLSHHTTHFLHPLQKSVSKLLKSAFNQACGTRINELSKEGITELIFGNLFAEAWGREASLSTWSTGFRVCHVYPVNKLAVLESAIAPSRAFNTVWKSEGMKMSTPRRKPLKQTVQHRHVQ